MVVRSKNMPRAFFHKVRTLQRSTLATLCRHSPETNLIKKSLPEMIHKQRASVSIDNLNYWVADSAMYMEENLIQQGKDLHWITRVP